MHYLNHINGVKECLSFIYLMIFQVIGL
uniref:Uncharacterized protein n=1 Tax=Anguilla anguilla TaxID=7936 RepID=A0A0E9U0Q4_ANGAN